MRIYLKTVLSIGLVLLIGCKNFKADYHNPTVDEVLERYYDAIGGFSTLKQVNSKIIRGTYFEPKYDLMMSSEMIYSRPNSRLMKAEGKLIGYVFEAFDGNTMWEYYKGDTIPRIMSGEAYKAGSKGAEFDESFVDYQAKNFKAKLTGIELVNSEKCYSIEVIMDDGYAKIYYFDTKTYLLKGLKKKMPLHAKGKSINWLTYYYDYRSVDGLLVPHISIRRNLDLNTLDNMFVIDTIILNSPIDSVNFSPHIPKGFEPK